MTTQRSIGENWGAWYRALKAANPDAYRKAINYPESVSINHMTPTHAAAEYERASVMLACELLGVRP